MLKNKVIRIGKKVFLSIGGLLFMVACGPDNNPNDCTTQQKAVNTAQTNMDNSFASYNGSCGAICQKYNAIKVEAPNADISTRTFENYTANNVRDSADRIVNYGIPTYASTATNPLIVDIRYINTNERVPDSTKYEIAKNNFTTATIDLANCNNQ